MGEEVEKLKTCPFCGGSARTHTYDTESLFSHAQVAWLTIQCMDCDILMSSEQHDEVRTAWNRRAVKAEESSVEAGWQPIKTVPKDGTRVDLFDGKNVNPYCRWGPMELAADGWWNSWSGFRPTHWRPHTPAEARSEQPPLDQAWAAVNVLGAPDTACRNAEDLAYCAAINDALAEIEKLGGRPS